MTAVELLPVVAPDAAAAVLLVDQARAQVLYANDNARLLAPEVGLPTALQEWSRAAVVEDLAGADLERTAHPLGSLVATGLRGQIVTARRASGATEAREPLWAVAVPLQDAPGLEGLCLVVLLPLRDTAAGVGLRDELRDDLRDDLRGRAVVSAGLAFTVADALAEDQPLVWVNPAFTAMTGYTADEVVGRNCRFLQGPETHPAAPATIRRVLQAGAEASVTLLNYRKDGTAFWNDLALSPVRDGDGRTTHYVGIQTDVTQRVVAASERTAEQRRLAVLAAASDFLSGAPDPQVLVDQLSAQTVPALADWSAVGLFDRDARVHAVAAHHHEPGMEPWLDRFRALHARRLLPASPVAAVLHEGASLVLEGERVRQLAPAVAEAEDAPELADVMARLGLDNAVVVPLRGPERVHGLLMFANAPGRPPLDAGDLAVAEDLGRRVGLTLDHARLYAREHQRALTLQRSLLPRLPEIGGLLLAADYLPAAEDSEVGGDWWDAFQLPDGATGLAVGDVMGHDLQAAAAMGQLRSVLRTCAWLGDAPSVVLERMDQLVQGFDMAHLATCVYARLQSGGPGRPSRLVWASAGHLPPVVLDPDGTARLLPVSGDLPVGVAPGRRTQQDVGLRPGSTLLLYSDGLVETRGGDIDDDVERLRVQVGRHRPADGPQALVDALTGDLDTGALTDDVALLAVQVLSSGEEEP